MLTASSSKLDALLLRRPKLHADLFTMLLDVTDQGPFVDFATRSDRVAQSLHVEFFGGSGMCLHAQLYHKRFEDVAGRTRHLIGIVEEPVGCQQEMQNLPTSREHEAWQIRSRLNCAASGSDHDGGGSVSDQVSVVSSSCSSSDSQFVPIHPVDQETRDFAQCDAAALWVDIRTPNCASRAARPSSPPFQVRLGTVKIS